MASSQCPVTIDQARTRATAAEMARHDDGSVNHASYVAVPPEPEDAAEGCRVTLSGRKLDQGVLARVAIEDRQVTAVHTVSLPGALKPATGGCDEDRSCGTGVCVRVQECAEAKVAGEWLIPNDGVLVVSLGAHTVADAQGKAVVRERVALVEARAVEVKPSLAVLCNPDFPKPPEAVPAAFDTGTRAPTIPMPAPAVPSRALPLARKADGTVEPLPPLPEDLSPPTALPGSSEPCATPQVRPTAPPVGDPIPDDVEKRDPASKRAGFDDETGCCALDGPCPAGARTAANPPVDPRARQFTIRIPLRPDLMIEVHGSARPLPFAGAPAPPLVRPSPED
jgi:hypothetical protein